MIDSDDNAPTRVDVLRVGLAMVPYALISAATVVVAARWAADPLAAVLPFSRAHIAAALVVTQLLVAGWFGEYAARFLLGLWGRWTGGCDQ